MKFQGIFRRINGSKGSVISDAPSLESAIQRTIFDATYCSPWKPEDITVLRIDDLDTAECLFAVNDTWKTADLKSLFG